MKYTLKYTRADAKAPEKQPVLNYKRVLFNSLSCKIILCVFDSDNGEFDTHAPDEAGAAVRIQEENLSFRHWTDAAAFRRIALLQGCLLISCKLAVIVGIKIQESTSAAPVPICQRKRCAVIC